MNERLVKLIKLYFVLKLIKNYYIDKISGCVFKHCT